MITTWKLNGGLALAVLLTAAISLLLGDVAVDIFAVAAWLSGSGADAAFYKILLEEIRGPRIVLAGLTGFVLGLSGAVIQGLLRNPLAEPGLLGAANGAALGAVIVIYAGLAATTSFAVPMAAALTALMAVMMLLALAGKGASSLRLILAGFAVSAFAGAGIALALNLSPNYFAALEIAFWLLGAVENRSWLHVTMALPGTIIGCGLMAMTARGLNALTLGEEVAASLGIKLSRLRAQAAIGLALAIGAVVAVTGVIGFVGLLAPHVARPLSGSLPSKTMLPSALIGAILLIVADSLIRLIPTTTELKLGVLTAFLGVPLLLFLLNRPSLPLSEQ